MALVLVRRLFVVDCGRVFGEGGGLELSNWRNAKLARLAVSCDEGLS